VRDYRRIPRPFWITTLQHLGSRFPDLIFAAAGGEIDMVFTGREWGAQSGTGSEEEHAEHEHVPYTASLETPPHHLCHSPTSTPTPPRPPCARIKKKFKESTKGSARKLRKLLLHWHSLASGPIAATRYDVVDAAGTLG
jgi:hypothetical protein